MWLREAPTCLWDNQTAVTTEAVAALLNNYIYIYTAVGAAAAHGPGRIASVVDQGWGCEDVGAMHQLHQSLVHLYLRNGLRDGALYVPDTALA